MKCERAREWFSDSIEDNLEEARAVVLNAHLERCSACRSDLETLKEVWNGLAGLPSLEAPPNLKAMIWQRIDADSAPDRFQRRPSALSLWPRWLRFAAAGVGAAALLAMATVTVPGRFREAGWTSWLGHRNPPTTGARNRVAVSARLIDRPFDANRPAKVLEITISGLPETAAPITVDLVSEDHILSSTEIIPQGPTVTVTIPAPTAAALRPIVRVHWNDDPGGRKSVSVPVHSRD